MIPLTNSLSPVLSKNTKVLALEKTFEQGLHEFKDLLIDFERLHITSENYRTQYIQQKEKCDSNSCSSADALKKIIQSKDNIIQLVASTLTRLSETRDLKILDEVFKILFGETPNMQINQGSINIQKDSQLRMSPVRLKQEQNSSAEDPSFKDESISEIEGTPTGRTSPIIPTKKLKSSLQTSSVFGDKKKCPETWLTPEKKILKTTSTPTRGKQNGRLRQSRLKVMTVKESNIIDITCSPEFSGGCRKTEHDGNKPLIKKESLENEDTILPSPTSGPTNFTLFKLKENSSTFKKPLSLKNKSESRKTPKKNDQSINKLEIKTEPSSENQLINNIKMDDSVTYTQEDSINLLNPKRIPNHLQKHSPIKQEHYDETYCETESSISLLHHVNKLEDIHNDVKTNSPSKSPLAENINVTNMPNDEELQASLSLLKRETKTNKTAVDNVKKKLPELADISDDEPTSRKKSEKLLLPGWSCEKCRDFYGELYSNDPEMLAKKMNECSRHRGNHNPTERPKTPPNYWNPRWEVPDNTEEFNRRNNVD